MSSPRRRQNWTFEEDEALRNHPDARLHLWSKIQKHPAFAKNGRSKASVRNRYLRLEKAVAAKEGLIPFKNRCSKCGEIMMGHSCPALDTVELLGKKDDAGGARSANFLTPANLVRGPPHAHNGAQQLSAPRPLLRIR